MDDELSYADLYKRYYPPFSKDDVAKFIIQTTRLEGYRFTQQDVVSGEISPHTCDPNIAGQIRTINYIKTIVPDPNLFFAKEKVTTQNFNNLFPFFKRLHKNLMYDTFLHNQRTNNNFSYPQLNELGYFRDKEKVIEKRKMPSPDRILPLLVDAFSAYLSVYLKHHDNISNPRMMEEKDWKRLETAAKDLGIAVCCIKPFEDGSNRVARLLENVCRLNVGLKLKTFEQERDYNDELKTKQPKFV